MFSLRGTMKFLSVLTRPDHGWPLAFILIFGTAPGAAQPISLGRLSAAEQRFAHSASPVLKQFCFDCHGQKKAKAQINLEQMSAQPDLARLFKTWEKVIAMLEQHEMPPEDEPQPTPQQREHLIATLKSALDDFIRVNAGDPGPIAIRRLTSAEYGYTIQDLTGLNLGIERGFIHDAVGGEGFSNVGDVQFIQDSTLERYLEAAKIVASHAVIGAGPLQFYRDPGKTGQELSAIHRIQQIYRQHGFRTGAGEGALAFGLDYYAKAFYAAWRYQYRRELGMPQARLEELAREEQISERFARHVWSVLNDADLSFPATEIAAAWRQLPAPNSPLPGALDPVRTHCANLYTFLRDWQSTLAANTGNDEEAPVLSEQSFRPTLKHSFRASVSWPAQTPTPSLELSVVIAGAQGKQPVVHWRQPRFRFRRGPGSRRSQEEIPLKAVVTESTKRQLRLGQGLNKSTLPDGDFVTRGPAAIRIEWPAPTRITRADFLVDAELDLEEGDDCLARCVIASPLGEDATAAASGVYSALLANPSSPQIEIWKAGVREFAHKLPQVSHREPAPSDRDPIPAPFDNTYNSAERNEFHSTIKYHRDDQFLVEHMLDDAARVALDQAWDDLLASFDYHETFLRFVLRKYQTPLPPGQNIRNLSPDWIATLPQAPRDVVARLHEQYLSTQRSLAAAKPRHIDNTMQFAELAWRRPLTNDESNRLRSFYTTLRNDLSHDDAIRALLTRILVAPAFLYRVESPHPSSTKTNAQTQSEPAQQTSAHPRLALSDWELANRLSYFLWSSIPDAELRQAAATRQLQEPAKLAAHAQRMLRDPKARRLATEFFGQWFGFYRFDEYRGIDTGRFPEFTDKLKGHLYDEAIAFFEHLVREDRPVHEVLFANYSFLNSDLARHYGVAPTQPLTNHLVRVDGLDPIRRGGLLRLGAVLTVTSAPLRTSAVKRGDWILRRVLGIHIPPPPGDAGSIPPDDVLSDGQTVRQRLEAHRREASCVNCHARIDPFGFALENFDPIGRWRDTYRDGQKIETSGTLHDGTLIAGPDGLDRYLRAQSKAFYRTLSTKLLGYALGRGELISDKLLIDQMVATLESDPRFSRLVEQVVTSPQFRFQRVTQETR